MGMAIHDLMPDKPHGGSGAMQQGNETPKIKQSGGKSKLQHVATYDYTDENGKLVFQKVRFVDENGKKTFRQRRPDGKGGWVYNLDGVDQVLYNLPEVQKAVMEGRTIVVVEGEKDVETLKSLGKTATTMPGGAGKWHDHHTSVLAKANIVIIADNDTPGKEHALHVRDALQNAECSVRLMIADGVKDVTDLIEAGGSLSQLRDFEEQLDSADSENEKPFDAVVQKLEKIFVRDDLTLNAKVLRAERVLLELTPETQATPTGRLVKWSDFILEEHDDSYDWVIPNLLERGERLIVVASEGVGKTVLGRQVALCSAAGIHPFTNERMPPIRTLMIDLENPARIIRRTSASIEKKSREYGFAADPQAHLFIKPDGLDLLKTSDRLLLEETIEKVAPDLIVLGPVYKAFIDPGGRTSESVTIEVAKYFDSLREWFKCAFWFEHHAPLGSSLSTRELRPFGSAVWSRWPEFGISLQPDPTADEGYVYEVKHFRGARDSRQFPVKMKRGTLFPFEVIEFTTMS